MVKQFTVINTKPNLNCTCTLIWLIQYKDRVSGGPQRLETSSTRNCLNSSDFEALVAKSNQAFNEICLNVTTSTTTTILEEPSKLDDYKIALIVVSAVLALIIFTLIGFFIIKAKRRKEPIDSSDIDMKRFKF